MVDLSVRLGSLVLKNPVMTASGTFGYGLEYRSLIDLNLLGGIIVKGLSLAPSAGNPPPRIIETPAGMLNAIGLQNIGVEAFIQEKLPALRGFDVAIIANIYGCTVEEYSTVARRLSEAEGITALEVNISCPNIKAGGIQFGKDPRQAGQLISAVRQATSLPLIVKLTPNTDRIREVALRVEDAGADCISLINTFIGMAIDVDTRTPLLATVTGGLSGPAIKPLALRMVWDIVQVVSVPVIGVGGISCSRDALEFIIAGAHAVQVGTANFINPGVCAEIITGIEAYLADHAIASISELRGSLRINTHDQKCDKSH
ncbi:MAG TPA: dihydroorotate dehydrogenase [Thermodesulfobacteriota bacterium]|nr:dihydroorotate dehydrogenase [Deltaproteobacteria bacterium]HNR12470.1 dihydroorotate dehydrogenase [Thermodesulfobacteriota bacterium]HOC38568.1 dihydroorotate dehydrogenase [Thermodesulfobacteriota bacterium]